MGKHTFFVTLGLTLVWILLMEELSWRSIGMGMMTTLVSLHFASKFLPYDEIKNVNFFKLATYPLFLIGQIYVAGFSVIKIILKGSKVDIVTVRTELKNDVLRIILSDSITLTPGSILLDLKGEFITLLWIRDKHTPGDSDTADRMLKHKLERRLMLAEINDETQKDTLREDVQD